LQSKDYWKVHLPANWKLMDMAFWIRRWRWNLVPQLTS